ncbi:MAG: nitroreductase [Methanosphaera sp. rholeuAM270]|nr:MAG: nitroreductase [Methanosphaera sp. rholeuAM270]
MTLIDTILKRRSIRMYTDEDIPEEKLEKILQAGLLAPTSRNRKPCIFKVVKNKDILKKLSLSKESGSAMIEGCNTAIVVFADSDIADTWIEDASISLAYMDLMANELGIGSCWCQSHLRFSADGTQSEEIVREIFSMDEKYRVVGILSLGIPQVELDGHSLSEIDENKIEYI